MTHSIEVNPIKVNPIKVNPIKVNPKEYISAALQFRELIQSKGYWVKLHKHDDVVDITWGLRWSATELEQAIATRTYYIFNNEVQYITASHA